MNTNTIAEVNKGRAVTPHSIAVEKLLHIRKQLGAGASPDQMKTMLDECIALMKPLDDYLLQHSSAPSAALRQLEDTTNGIDWKAAYEQGKTTLQLEQEMLSGGLEGQFLKMLVKIAKARSILEIGSFTGYASLAMAEALPEDGKLIACEYDPFAAQVAREAIDQTPYAQLVDIRIGDAMQTLQELKATGTTFDFVFLDADKKGYLKYFQFLLDENLLASGGIVAVDNTLFMGQVYGVNITENGESLATFNQAIADNPEVEQVMIPIRDGVTIIRKK